MDEASGERHRSASRGPLYKTTIVIWSQFPGEEVELAHLAWEAESGEAYCVRYHSDLVTEPERDVAWDGTEFFDLEVD